MPTAKEQMNGKIVMLGVDPVCIEIVIIKG